MFLSNLAADKIRSQYEESPSFEVLQIPFAGVAIGV